MGSLPPCPCCVRTRWHWMACECLPRSPRRQAMLFRGKKETYKTLAAPQGFEPRYADPESAVLPLNEGAVLACGIGSYPTPILGAVPMAVNTRAPKQANCVLSSWQQPVDVQVWSLVSAGAMSSFFFTFTTVIFVNPSLNVGARSFADMRRITSSATTLSRR